MVLSVSSPMGGQWPFTARWFEQAHPDTVVFFDRTYDKLAQHLPAECFSRVGGGQDLVNRILSIEADDQQFDPNATREFLQGLEPSHVELVEETP